MNRFEGKVALLTGAASGVGRATALYLAGEGASIFGVDIDEIGLKDTADQIAEAGGRMACGSFDISRTGDCNSAVDACVAKFSRLDTLGNIAGVNRFSLFSQLTEEEWDLLVGVNLKGATFMSQAALPHLISTQGTIVNVVSTASFIGQAYTVAYCATKGGLLQLTRALAAEYIEEGVRINAVAPGGVNTPMNTKMQFPEGMNWELVKSYAGRRGMCEPHEVAAAIAYLASDEARFVHGATLSIDGGVVAGV